MDISLTNLDNNLNKSLTPRSIHGMLWLQTHFQDIQWEALSEGRVILSEEDAKLLKEDAELTGIRIEFISDLSILDVLTKTN